MTLMSILLGSGPGRAVISLTASGNNYDVYTNRGPAYQPGKSDITVNVPAPTTIGSSSTGAYAMLVPNAFNPTDTVTIINDGVIQGAGGNGGAGGPGSQPGSGQPGSPGATGGNALYINRPTTITNNGTIAGGGGGGGGGGGYATGTGPFKAPYPNTPYPGGGGGGGAGTIGGSGGSPNGGTGTSASGGGGGGGASSIGGPGGPGGGRGAAGSGGASSGAPGAPGGAAGNYIVGNPFVTWPVTGTRQGGVA